jgi:N-acetylglucosamine-6-phosphate deacetylase
MLIKNCKIIYPSGIEEGSVLVRNGKIEEINPPKLPPDEVLDANGLYLSPGFIDIHIHGAGGYDTMEGSYKALNEISKAIASHGTTAFLPTTMTCASSEILEAVHAINHARAQGTEGAQILGVHLEGPFISPAMIGAQNPQYIEAPSIDTFKNLVGDYMGSIKTVTLAPETQGALELIQFLHAQGITVSIGHSKATYKEAMAGIKAGASHSTHLFNAMTGLHHRDGGVVGAVFDSPITTEAICDGVHVDYPVLRIALKQKSTDRMLLISDAMMACCMPNGRYVLGGQDVIAQDGAARLENGALAGSVLTLDQAIKNIYEHTDYELFEIIKMAALNPAKHCGVADKKGQIAEGYDADLVLFDENITIHKVFIGGKIF